MDIKEEVRRFLIYDLHISPPNIDEIKVDLMKDGQIRDIVIHLIPNIKGEQTTNDKSN